MTDPRDAALRALRRMLANGLLTALPKRPADQEILLVLAASRFDAGDTYARKRRERAAQGLARDDFRALRHRPRDAAAMPGGREDPRAHEGRLDLPAQRGAGRRDRRDPGHRPRPRAVRTARRAGASQARAGGLNRRPSPMQCRVAIEAVRPTRCGGARRGARRASRAAVPEGEPARPEPRRPAGLRTSSSCWRATKAAGPEDAAPLRSFRTSRN